MKKFSFTLLFVISCIVSYYIGYTNTNTKNYEAACLQADFIRSLMDWDGECYNVGAEVEESYYEWFQDLDMGVYNTKKLSSINELKQYYWCY